MVTPGAAVADAPLTVPELEAQIRSASDKERLVGLLAAPWAAGIGVLVVAALINHDPTAHLASGLVNSKHVSVTFYYGVLAALLALSVLMLAFAWFRKRVLLGVAMAMYGLTLFNLHWWGFAVPYLLCAGWLLVRAYRLHQDLRAATGDAPAPRGAARVPRVADERPTTSKRYTPPASRAGR